MRNLTFSQLADELDLYAKRMREGDWTDAMEKVIPDMRAGIAANFSATASPSGQAWPPRRQNYPWPLLVKSGNMRNSFINKGSGGYRLITGKSAAIASTVRSPSGFNYPRLHNFGGGRMPARTFAGINREALKEIADKLSRGIMRLITE